MAVLRLPLEDFDCAEDLFEELFGKEAAGKGICGMCHM